MWIKSFEQEDKGYLEDSPHSGALQNKAEEGENNVEAVLIFWLRNDGLN